LLLYHLPETHATPAPVYHPFARQGCAHGDDGRIDKLLTQNARCVCFLTSCVNSPCEHESRSVQFFCFCWQRAVEVTTRILPCVELFIYLLDILQLSTQQVDDCRKSRSLINVLHISSYSRAGLGGTQRPRPLLRMPWAMGISISRLVHQMPQSISPLPVRIRIHSFMGVC
jgi:hypothetical protein